MLEVGTSKGCIFKKLGKTEKGRCLFLQNESSIFSILGIVLCLFFLNCRLPSWRNLLLQPDYHWNPAYVLDFCWNEEMADICHQQDWDTQQSIYDMIHCLVFIVYFIYKCFVFIFSRNQKTTPTIIQKTPTTTWQVSAQPKLQ
jgi:hypothetical protein